jgi:hypothetical protein
MMGQAQALTDINNNPYQAYQGQQVAGFSPLQTQAMGNIQGMTPSSQLSQATGMAGMAGLGGLSAGNNYNPSVNNFQMSAPQQTSINDFSGQNVQQYMSPYEQNVVNQQSNQAINSYAQQLPQLGSTAAASGNLGSSREAIMQGIGNQGLQAQLQGIQASGLQNAYQNAQSQFNTQNQLGLQSQQANQQANLMTGIQNLGASIGTQGQALQSQQFGANLGLQGLGVANSAANTLNSTGQQQYAQQAGIDTAQLGAGALGQQLNQNQLNTNYQNFVNQQNYPYAQLSFMGGILGNAAATTGNTGISSAYQQAPNLAGQVAGNATGLAGLFGSLS